MGFGLCLRLFFRPVDNIPKYINELILTQNKKSLTIKVVNNSIPKKITDVFLRIDKIYRNLNISTPPPNIVLNKSAFPVCLRTYGKILCFIE